MAEKKKPKREPKSYHHGNLQRVVLEKAVTHIQKNGVQSLSIRDIAREIGVSHTAPYRHFPDKQSLLGAIALEGYQMLIKRVQEVVDASHSLSVQIENMAWEYTQFVLNYPVYAELMFSKVLQEREKLPELNEAGAKLFAIGEMIIRQGQVKKKIVNGDVNIIAASAWAHVHGLALLLSSGRIGKNVPKAEGVGGLKALVTHSTQLLFAGILLEKK